MNKKKSILIILSFILIYGCKENRRIEDKTLETEREAWILWAANWSPNDEQISVGGTQDTLRLFSANEFQLLKNYPYKGTITKTKWHPTKNKLAISVQDGVSKSIILNLDNDEMIALDSITFDGARAIGWNHSGDLLAVGDYDGYLTIFDEKGNFIKRVSTNQKSIIGLDWHPNENLIVAVGEKITLYHYDMERLINIEDRSEDVMMLCTAWNPNGKFFVTGDYGDFEYHYPPLLQYWTYDGQRIKSIEQSKAELRNMKWSGDGNLLATASEKIRLWNKNGDLVKESDSENLLWGIDWNKSDTKIVTTDMKGGILIWDKELNQIKELQY